MRGFYTIYCLILFSCTNAQEYVHPNDTSFYLAIPAKEVSDFEDSYTYNLPDHLIHESRYTNNDHREAHARGCRHDAFLHAL
ncbi:MAG: hypothetical protein AAFN65_02780, partial [Bacteroidota bacterium]